jgi:hypothetical protein
MKRPLFGLLLVALTIASRPAAAFDRILHYDLVYAAALVHGFSREEAGIIASACYSLDDNDSTTAYSGTLIANEFKALPDNYDKLSELPHMRSGQVFHALAPQDIRETVEKAHLARLHRAHEDRREPGTAEQKRMRELLYFGQYLHFVGDLVVHPDNSFVGHALLGEESDRADRHPDQVRIAMALISERLRDFHEGRLPSAPVDPRSLAVTPKLLDKEPSVDHVLEQAARAASESWGRTYPDSRSYLAATGVDLYVGKNLETERQKVAHAEIGKVLVSAGYGKDSFRPYKPIDLDRDGEPVGDDLKTFGSGRRIDVLPFATTLASSEALEHARRVDVLDETFRAAGKSAEVAAQKAVEAVLPLPPEDIDNARKAAVWFPPSSPGGVALDPRLSVPLGDIGSPRRIASDDGSSLYVETIRGRFAFDGVSARRFATLARTVAQGQIPFLTIGTDPSDRDGYAHVTYAPSLVGTAEGGALYRADVLFKTIFAQLPLDAATRDGGIAPLFAGFPGVGGDYVRLWITSSHIRLRVDGDRLVTDDPGMHVYSETRLHYRVRADPEMEAFADRLTRHWSELAEALSPFREVQQLALTTAIVFWARAERIEIEPAILLLPSEPAYTPEYARIVSTVRDGRSLSVCGGVALTPEDRGSALGREYLSGAGLAIERGTSLELAGVGAACLLLPLLLPSLLLWRLLREGAGLKASRWTYKRALALWAALCGMELCACALVYPLLVAPDVLSPFDRDFLALAVTSGLFFVLLLGALRRFREPSAEGLPRRFAKLALAVAGPACSAAVGVALANFTVIMTGPVPSPGLDAVLTAELSEYETLGMAFVTVSLPSQAERQAGMRLYPVPESVMETLRPDYEHRMPSVTSSEELEGPRHPKAPELLEALPESESPFDSLFPVTKLRRVQWPDDVETRPRVTHYTVDGRPPF